MVCTCEHCRMVAGEIKSYRVSDRGEFENRVSDREFERARAARSAFGVTGT